MKSPTLVAKISTITYQYGLCDTKDKTGKLHVELH